MIAAFDQIGNPSSVHQEGRKARAILDAARDAVADLCGGSARDVIFTSGGTEAISLGLTPSLLIEGDRRPFTHCLITRVEHACVLQGHRFGADHVRLLEVDGSGLVQMDGLSWRSGGIGGTWD